MKDKIIEYLLDNADPSIVLRVKKEILHSCSESEEESLMEKITEQKIVQTILKSQKADGWIGNNFHGSSPKNGAGMYDNMEVGLRYLVEKGFQRDNAYIKRAVDSIVKRAQFDSACGCKILTLPQDDYSLTAWGLYLSRSSLLIRVGYENMLPAHDFINLKHDIDYSLDCFFNVLNYDDIYEVLDTHRKKLTFKQGMKWPCIYDLRMLAHSNSWKNQSNKTKLVESINKLFEINTLNEMVYSYNNGQYVGPCFAFIGQQMNILQLESNGFSLDCLELFSRCGVINDVAIMKSKYDELLASVNLDLSFNFSFDKKKEFSWSPYFGYALSENWKEDTNVRCDILFRILLIMYYAEQNYGR
jgi:hypothetical protein